MAPTTIKLLTCLVPFLSTTLAAPQAGWAPAAPSATGPWGPWASWKPSGSGAWPSWTPPSGKPWPSSTSAAASACSSSAATGLPTVDLGYEVHQAIAYNDTGNYYNFSNIRYAQSPTGNLRFRAPEAPLQNRGQVQAGAGVSPICPQADPIWINYASTWIGEYLTGKPINISMSAVEAVNASLTTANALQAIPQAPGASEDCLFLDVMVPKNIFDNGGCDGNGKGAAVLVWIYGGGYTAGSKAGSGNPAGLLERSMTGGREGVIYVAMNYRLGMFGWMAGPTFQEDGTVNAGLYDQRFALEWVQQNIHLFGGDPDRVTIFGESAGGGSIMHQVTAWGGLQGPAPYNGSAPFQQAIMQSPGFFPQPSNAQLENQYNNVLAIANVSDVSALRSLSTEQLQAVNLVTVGQAQYGQFTFGPAVDGYFVPAMPGKLLLDGNFNHDLNIMVGHNLDEGLLFTDPFVNTSAAFDAFQRTAFPAATDAALDYITNTLYPASAFPDTIARSALELSELSFTCNTRFLDLAFGNKTYSYYFAIPPGLHGMDIPYTYYNGPSPSVINATAAIALQDWIVTFAEDGMPSSPDVPGAPAFNIYGANSTVEEIETAAIVRAHDTVANSRCDWWQKALYV